MKQIEKNNVVLVIEDLKVENLYTSEFQGKVRVSAHISQERKVSYPSQNMGTGFGGGLFENVQSDPYVSKRHTLIVVPEGQTEQSVQEQSKAFPEATIYRVLSNNIDDVISEREKSAIESGLITKESLKAKYLVRDKDGNVYSTATVDGEVLEGDARKVGLITKSENGELSVEITNPNALLEYKRDIFSRVYREDIDNRVTVKQGAEQVVEHEELAV